MLASVAAFPFSYTSTGNWGIFTPMKSSLALSLLAAAILFPSCTTVQREVTAKILARRATYEVLRAKPEYKPAFVATVTAIDALLLDETIDRAAFTLALQNLKIHELKGAEGALIIADILDIIDIAIEDKPLLGEGLPQLRAITKSLSEGIAGGIALASALAPPAPHVP